MTNRKSARPSICQYRYENLKDASSPINPAILHKVLWYLRRRGFMYMLKRTSLVFRSKIDRSTDLHVQSQKRKTAARYKKCEYAEVLNLQPGELVEVKSEEEIRETLDIKWKNKGLEFTPEMLKYCGKRFKVYKRLGKIILENTGEIRRIRNTVLLDGAICDGSEHFDCDRSCFHYWREAWLKRVNEQK